MSNQMQYPSEDAKEKSSQSPRVTEAPGFLLAHAFEPNKITLLWSASRAADGYLVLRGSNPNDLKVLASVEEASYIDTQVEAGASYTYAVRAHNADGYSAPTAASYVTMPVQQETPPLAAPRLAANSGETIPISDVSAPIKPAATQNITHGKSAVPAAPAMVRAIPQGTRQIAVRWHPGEDGGNQTFRLFRSLTPWCCYALAGETSETHYIDTVPHAGTKYYYFVQSMTDGRTSPPSSMAEASTYPPLPAPETPCKPRVAAVTASTVELHWRHAKGAAAYLISARRTGEEFRIVGTTADVHFTHEELPPQTRFDYRIQSYHDSGVSEASPIASATTRSAPPQRTQSQNQPQPPQKNMQGINALRFPQFSLQGLGGGLGRARKRQ